MLTKGIGRNQIDDESLSPQRTCPYLLFMESTMDSANLRSKIEGLRRQNAQNQTYIPDLLLFLLITHEVVHTELKMGNVKPYLLEELTRKIMAGAKKVFAILVLIGEVRLVKDLMERDQLQDYSLPLPLDILEDFGDVVALNFRQGQLEFLAPQFTRSMISKPITPKNALPFLRDEKIGNGGFGTIYEISLDPDHQNFRDGFSKRVGRT
jgi:hypothetical protein